MTPRGDADRPAHWLHYLGFTAWLAQLLVGSVVLLAWCAQGREPGAVEIVLLLVLSGISQGRQWTRAPGAGH